MLLCLAARQAGANDLRQLFAEQASYEKAASSVAPLKQGKEVLHEKNGSGKDKNLGKPSIASGTSSGSLAAKMHALLAGNSSDTVKHAAKLSGTVPSSVQTLESMKSKVKNPKGYRYALSPVGIPTMIAAEDLSDAVVATDTKTTAKLAVNGKDHLARAFLRSNQQALKLADTDSELSLKATAPDTLGITRHRYQQLHNGLPVWGREVSVYENSASAITLFVGNYLPTPAVDTTPVVTSAEAIQKVILDLDLQPADVSRQDAALVIWHDENTRTDYLTWHIEVAAGSAIYWHYFVDARDGVLRNRFSGTMRGSSVPASGVNLKGVTKSFTVWQENGLYNMIDVTRPVNEGATMTWQQKGDIWVTDSQTGKIITSTSAISGWSAAAVSAISNIYTVLDYYKNTHGLVGYSSTQQNVALKINGSAASEGFPDNAFFSGQDYTLNFGRGGTNFSNLADGLDVVAHEFTHGVVASTANLVYQNQSGALNESYADVFAAMIDRGNWTIGEDVYLHNAGVMRDMRNPNNGDPKQPATMREYIATAGDSGGVHGNSGIPNRAAWLVAEGLTAEGLGTSIGREKTEKIWYRALTTYLHPYDRFLEARRALIQAAIDLYGDSAEAAAVRAAWDTVGVGDAMTGISSSATPASTDPLPGSDLLVTVLNGGIYLQSPSGAAGPLNTMLARNSRPAVVVGSNDTFILYVDDVVNDLRVISVSTALDTKFDGTYYYWNIAIPQNAGTIAYSKLQPEPYLYIVDYQKLTETPYLLAFQTDGGTSVGTIQFADAMSFDFTGQKLVFDAQSTFSSAGLPDYSNWTIGILDLASGGVTAPLPPQAAGIDIGNPVFAANNNHVIAFDYNDANVGEQAIITYNLAEGLPKGLGVVAFSGPTDPFTILQPFFNGADSAIVIRYEPISGNSSIRSIPLTVTADKSWQGTISAMSQFSDSLGSFPLVFRNSVRTLDARLDVTPTTLDLGTVASGAGVKKLITIQNTGNVDVTLKDMQLTGTGFAHNGTLGLFPRNSSMTVEVSYTASPTPGVKSASLTIVTDAAAPYNSIPIQFTATVSAAATSNGVCGSANGTIVTSAPTTNLCSTGTASTVTGYGPWSWSCQGSNGGANAACSAASQSVPVTGKREKFELMTRSNDGKLPSNHSQNPALTPDGRYVVFDSRTPELSTLNTNGVFQVYLRDRTTDLLELISINSSGEAGDKSSEKPSISHDGCYVVFESSATNLDASDTNKISDIYLRDRCATPPTTTLISFKPDNTLFTYLGCHLPEISGDGRSVVYEASVDSDIYIYDRLGKTNTAMKAFGRSPVISNDGLRIAFWKYGHELVSGDTNGLWDIFLYDRTTRAYSMISTTSNGAQQNQGGEGVSTISDVAISGDGRYVAFSSRATNLVPGDNNGVRDVFVKDTQTGVLTRASVSSSGVEGNAESAGVKPSLSLDGTWVGFMTNATNLAQETASINSVVAHNIKTGQTVGFTPLPSSGTATERPLALSGDIYGRYVSFYSTAHLDSRYDSAGVFFHDRHSQPIAVAKVDATVVLPGKIGQVIMLDGSESHDVADNYPSVTPADKLKYTWTQISGPTTVTLSSVGSPKPTFTVPVAGTYVFSLIVEDDYNDFSEPSQIAVEIAFKGNVNNDSTINVFDALLTLQYAVGLYKPEQANEASFKTAADVAPLDAGGKPKGDGVVNVFDALAILRHAVGLDGW